MASINLESMEKGIIERTSKEISSNISDYLQKELVKRDWINVRGVRSRGSKPDEVKRIDVSVLNVYYLFCNIFFQGCN